MLQTGLLLPYALIGYLLVYVNKYMMLPGIYFSRFPLAHLLLLSEKRVGTSCKQGTTFVQAVEMVNGEAPAVRKGQPANKK